MTNPRSGPLASGPLYSCFLEYNQSNKSAVPVTGQMRTLHRFDEAMKDRNASSDTEYPALPFDQARQTLATHLVASNLKAPPIAKTHVLMTRAAAIGLMRLAQQASRTRGFWAFAFVVHGRLLHPLDETIDHLLLAGLLEGDGELVAVDLDHAR